MKSALRRTSIPLALIVAALCAPIAAGDPFPQNPATLPQIQQSPTLPLPRPDLEFRVAWLQAPARPVTLTSVPIGKSYRACFKVWNIGAVASGPYRVGAGGLGVATAPYLDFPGLATGATQTACIPYPTTPPVGTYNLGMTVDSLYAVAEIREDNNNTVVRVNVVPR